MAKRPEKKKSEPIDMSIRAISDRAEIATMKRLLAMTPAERLRYGVESSRNCYALVEAARRNRK